MQVEKQLLIFLTPPTTLRFVIHALKTALFHGNMAKTIFSQVLYKAQCIWIKIVITIEEPGNQEINLHSKLFLKWGYNKKFK